MRYWVVSANVHGQGTAKHWIPVIYREKAVFMGWDRSRRLGKVFQEEVKPGDSVLIAYGGLQKPGQRRLVACGSIKRPIRGRIASPDSESPSAGFRLSPFFALDDDPARVGIDFAGTPYFGTKQPPAIFEIDPSNKSYPGNQALCGWLNGKLNSEWPIPPAPGKIEVRTATLSRDCVESFEYSVLPRNVSAERREAALVLQYGEWLRGQGRSPEVKSYRRPSACLICDLFEPERNNLIEAKSTIDRASIRMAIGQLFDYCFCHERATLPKPNLGILLPQRPPQDLLDLMHSLKIAVIWKSGNTFQDTVRGQFT